MSWNVEYTDEFGEWWKGLSEDQQEDFAAMVKLLMDHGPQLPFPYSSGIKGSRHAHMRELQVVGSHCAGFMLLIHGARLSCLLAEAKRVTIGSTKRRSPSLTACTTTILLS